MQNVDSWFRMEKNLTYLPLLMAQKIWLARNRCIFDDKKTNINFIVHTLLEQLQIYPVHSQLKLKRRTNGLAHVFDFIVGFFEGASANGLGGIGVHLMFSQDHYICMKMGVGQRTNTRLELLALWTLLFSTKSCGLPFLHIHGDSSVIINWFNRRSSLSSLALDGWCHNIRDLESCFIQLDAVHIYREYNEMVDCLSKEALSMALGLLQFSEFTEGECTELGSFQLFQL